MYYSIKNRFVRRHFRYQKLVEIQYNRGPVRGKEKRQTSLSQGADSSLILSKQDSFNIPHVKFCTSQRKKR